MSTAENAESISLEEMLDQQWLRLPHAAMVEAGPASQTLGGLLEITNRETFVTTAAIAAAARVPCREVPFNQLDGFAAFLCAA